MNTYVQGARNALSDVNSAGIQKRNEGEISAVPESSESTGVQEIPVLPGSNTDGTSERRQHIPTHAKKYLSSQYSESKSSLDYGDFNRPFSTCCPKRYTVAFMGFFGFFNVYCLRVNLSVALVAMTNNHTRRRFDGEKYWVPAEFDWSNQIQGHILAAFYYGYLVAQIPGGYIAVKFGGKNLFGLSILLAALLTMLTPIASRKHWTYLFTLRLLEGICESCAYPAMFAIWTRWAPPLERARLATIPHAGSDAGSVVGTLVAAYLCELCGWAWMFYLFGVFSLAWVILWLFLITDAPELDPHITRMEREYIVLTLKQDQASHPVTGSPPWRSIFTSLPFWAILVAHTCEGWGFNTFQSGLPKYLHDRLGCSIFQSGLYTGMMYLVMGVVILIAGQLSDILRIRTRLTPTIIRKIFTLTGFSLNAICMLASLEIRQPKTSIIVMMVGTGIESLSWAGFAINHLDIAPRYASLLFGITNTAATIPGIISPLAIGAVMDDENLDGWNEIFITSACLFIFGGTFYLLFGSAERQEWAEDNLNRSSLGEIDLSDSDEDESREKRTR